jgi:hypothetical protein
MRRAVLLLAAACSGVQADTGDEAYMHIYGGAQFVQGAMPTGSASGPGVATITLVNSNIWPGLNDFAIAGDLDPAATAVALGLRGDVGYWILPAGVPSFNTPSDPTFAATAGFSALSPARTRSSYGRSTATGASASPPRRSSRRKTTRSTLPRPACSSSR